MKTLISTLCLSFLFAQGALAQTYECRTVYQADPWSQVGSSDGWSDSPDLWTVIVDLTAGQVQLSSDNELFGPNPFATLTEASPRGHAPGTRVFRGSSNERKTYTYMVAFGKDGKQAHIERREGRGSEMASDSLDCQLIK